MVDYSCNVASVAWITVSLSFLVLSVARDGCPQKGARGSPDPLDFYMKIFSDIITIALRNTDAVIIQCRL